MDRSNLVAQIIVATPTAATWRLLVAYYVLRLLR